MKVYLVEIYEDLSNNTIASEIVRIFSTREEAENFAEEMNDHLCEIGYRAYLEAGVEEMEVYEKADLKEAREIARSYCCDEDEDESEDCDEEDDN